VAKMTSNLPGVQHNTSILPTSILSKDKPMKRTKKWYYTAPETITFGQNSWQMQHEKIAKRTKKTDDTTFYGLMMTPLAAHQ
jgi:hypothetical protein